METLAEQYFKVNCPNCFQHIECPQELSGQTIDCPTCNKPFRVEFFKAPDYPPNPELPVSSSETLPESLPKISDESLRSIQVRSSSSDRFYTVNLIDYTCTCPSFLEVHSKSPPQDFGRLCKHLCASLKRPEMLRLLSPIGLAIVQEGFGVYPGRFERDRNGNLIYITGVNNSGWINVYALKRRDGKTYYRFGYSLNEQRWAFGVSPAVNIELLNPTSNFQSLVSSPVSSSGLGWQIFTAVFRGISKVIMVLAKIVIYIFGVLIVVFLRLLVSGMKPRRRRRF
jgi:hypothetical protein